ncbi:DMT family transporter [Brevibacillus fluminis]|uniref:DMT family transporter n=1 Tax=Brevibacillus fluminis TaxID=511487 RepID=UPI003F893F6E
MILLNYIVMCLIFSTSFLAIKLGLTDGMPPFFFAALRFLLAGALILAFLGLRKQWTPLPLRSYLEIAIVAFLMTTIPFASLYWAEQHISSGMAALLVATAPIFSTLLTIALGQVRFRWHLLAGLLLGIVGIYLVVGATPEAAEQGPLPLIGKLAIISSEFIYAIGVIRSKRLLHTVPPLTFNALQMTFASVGLLILSLLFEDTRPISFTTASLSSLLYLACIVSILAFGMFYWLLKETNPTFPVTWTYVSPVIALVIGAVFYREPVSVAQLAGGCSVLLGIVLLNASVWRKRERTSAVPE